MKTEYKEFSPFSTLNLLLGIGGGLGMATTVGTILITRAISSAAVAGVEAGAAAIGATAAATASVSWIPIVGWIVGIGGAISVGISLRNYYGGWSRSSVWDDIIEMFLQGLRKKIFEISSD